jgi:hypothetical protein
LNDGEFYLIDWTSFLILKDEFFLSKSGAFNISDSGFLISLGCLPTT